VAPAAGSESALTGAFPFRCASGERGAEGDGIEVVAQSVSCDQRSVEAAHNFEHRLTCPVEDGLSGGPADVVELTACFAVTGTPPANSTMTAEAPMSVVIVPWVA
jgi:hypothetical protein